MSDNNIVKVDFQRKTRMHKKNDIQAIMAEKDVKIRYQMLLEKYDLVKKKEK